MTAETSIGPDRTVPTEERRETRATTGGVDAHAANEFDIRHGLAGAEAKPFSEASSSAGAAPETPEHGEDSTEQQEAKQQGLVGRPVTAFPPSGQQGAGADRPQNPER